MRKPHCARLMGHSPAVEALTPKHRLTNSFLFDLMFLFHYGRKKKSFLQVAPQAFPWGLDETQLKNKEQKQ